MAEKKRIDIIIGARDRAGKVLKRLAGSVGRLSRRFAKIGGIVGGVVTAAIVELGRRGAGTVDMLAKLARRTGENINTLNQLRGAADRAGVGADTVNAAIDSLQKRLGEAALGRGAAKDVLGQLGIDAQRIVDMKLVDQLALIADRMKDVEGQTRRLQVASNLFSKSNMRMVLLLQNGSEAFRESLRNMERFQARLTMFDASKVEKANDAIANLKTALGGIGQLISVRMAPQIEQFATNLAKRMADSGERIATLLTEPFRGMLFLINQAFGDASNNAKSMAEKVIDALGKISRWVGKFIATLPERIKVMTLKLQKFFITNIRIPILEFIANLPIPGSNVNEQAAERLEWARADARTFGRNDVRAPGLIGHALRELADAEKEFVGKRFKSIVDEVNRVRDDLARRPSALSGGDPQEILKLRRRELELQRAAVRELELAGVGKGDTAKGIRENITSNERMLKFIERQLRQRGRPGAASQMIENMSRLGSSVGLMIAERVRKAQDTGGQRPRPFQDRDTAAFTSRRLQRAPGTNVELQQLTEMKRQQKQNEKRNKALDTMVGLLGEMTEEQRIRVVAAGLQ